MRAEDRWKVSQEKGDHVGKRKKEAGRRNERRWGSGEGSSTGKKEIESLRIERKGYQEGEKENRVVQHSESPTIAQTGKTDLPQPGRVQGGGGGCRYIW